nr:MAG TPA: hypothetical protein [Bacteriophage sp.]
MFASVKNRRKILCLYFFKFETQFFGCEMAKRG